MKQKFNNFTPLVHSSVYMHETAVIIGNAVVEENCSIWPGAVLRADIAQIKIGAGSNVQDNVSIHVDYNRPALIGKNVTIGHNAVVHGALVGDNSLIGMGSVIMESDIGPNCIIGAGTVLPAGKTIPAGSLVMGVPAKIVRTLSEGEIKTLQQHGQEYVKLAEVFKNTCEEF